MQRPARSARPPKAQAPVPPNFWRDRLAVLLALLTVVCLASAFLLAKDKRFLSPGPLTSAHGAIESCSTCHTHTGSGNLTWAYSLFTRDPHADSAACLTCHKMPATAFNAHGTSPELLRQSTKRLAKTAAQTPAPVSASLQRVAFPTRAAVERGLPCATCHREHRGVSYNLKRPANEQCNSCHVVKFDSFDGNHPAFESYPFKRRTPIIYDHAGHFGKHFPEVAKKEPGKRIPATCSACHDSREDKRVMAVVRFEQTCSSCHLQQITGKGRVSGPKGIAFLSLPGLDLQTLRKKNTAIGEWPSASEAELTPFMKVMISRTERGRALIKTVDRLNLQDLSDASDDQIEAVAELVWEIKRLFYALIAGKASDVLGNLNINCGARLSAGLVADLTASIPRDVVVSAHQQWLPNLGAEMAGRQDATAQEEGCWIEAVGGWSTTISESPNDASGSARPGRVAAASPRPDAKDAPGAVIKSLGVDPYGRLVKGREDEAEAAAEAAKAEAAKSEAARADSAPPRSVGGRADAAPSARPGRDAPAAGLPLPPKGADQTDDLLNLSEDELQEVKAARPPSATVRTFTIISRPDGAPADANAAHPAGGQEDLPPAMKAGLKELAPAEPARPAYPRIAQADGARGKAADQTDDLLYPTEDELRGVAPAQGGGRAPRPEDAAPPPARGGEGAAAAPVGGGRAAPPESAPRSPAPALARPEAAPPAAPKDAAPRRPDADAPPPADVAAAAPPKAAPVISIESDIDPESWAEYGGWYRQDYTIYYRPIGHKDKFIYSWLYLTGPQAPKGDRSPAAAVFDALSAKDAQGACTKCHSVDDLPGQGRLVNFSPPSGKSKLGRFTTFIHEPHFGVLENRGCLTCHSLEKNRPYLRSYEHGNPKKFVSNFGAVKEELCQSCHARGLARQDCLLCHRYHVDGVVTPMMSTRIPIE